ncbi:MAG: 2-succinyl-5-enolpyruvyl-6-hydroxy-3-cyclohexene-1-carboxylic-acid synthase [Cyclobacteriaceae bacterium]|nr:2-succinyl-5-enolpyruvyl-6-hydroxy-3-cyclohexene-1-carboxylic-acid synthase [Cyclobacteriaceae bacterium]
MSHRSVAALAEILYQKGIRNVIISPGSRSAPITLAFARHPGFRKFVILDERSAGYTGLGMSQVLNQPVVLVCTSGTAAINFYPAIAEAFYLQVPLVILTADRPPEWIDQHDGQTIHQEALYQNHIKGFYTFPQEDQLPDVKWHIERIVSEAVNQSLDFPRGPVHINMPFREPLYPPSPSGAKQDFTTRLKMIRKLESLSSVTDSSWNELSKTWDQSGKVLIVGGQLRLDPGMLNALNEFVLKFHVPVVGDAISNLHGLGQNLITYGDPVLWSRDEGIQESLRPDLLISFGKSIITKNLKLFLRRFKPLQHWHLQPAGYVPDPFQTMTTEIPVDPGSFFGMALDKFKSSGSRKDYLHIWEDHEKTAEKKVKSFFPAEEFNELEAVFMVLKHLPDHILLHLANSMPVRLVNFLGGLKPGMEIFANRGTSGIDGCVSTAVGTAIQSDKLNVLITGDMSFFYDRNAFWHDQIPGNMHIVMLNNHGGGIFRMIDGPSEMPEFEKYFETCQPLSAGNLAGEYGFEYRECHTREALKENLETFFRPAKKLKILEIQTESKTNKTIFDQFKTQFY